MLTYVSGVWANSMIHGYSNTAVPFRRVSMHNLLMYKK